MLDISKEQPLSLNEAAAVLPRLGGKKIHSSTIWRWCRKGIKGTRLEYARLGDRIITTEQALVRFANRLSERDVERDCQTARVKPTSSKTRRRAIEQAERRLDQAGL